MSIGQLAACLVVVTALPLLLLATVMYGQMVASARQTARDNLMSNARALAALAENEIETHTAIASTLASSDALQRNDLAAFERHAREALRLSPGGWINLVAPSGSVVFSTVGDTQVARQGSPLPAVTRAFATGMPQLSDIMEGPVSKRLAAFVAVPVLKDSVPIYVIAIAINPDRLQELLENKFGDVPAIAILDRQYRFLARVPDRNHRLGTLAAASWRAEIARAPEGVHETVTLEGAPSFTAYVTLRQGWIAGLSFPKHVVDAPATRILWTMLTLGLATSLASAGLGFMGSRHLGSIMGSLAAAARKVGSGEVVGANRQRIVEADAIAEALSTTSQELAARTAQLKRAHDTFFNLVLHAPFGVYVVDQNLRLAQVSAGAKQAFINVRPLLGRDLGEALRILWDEEFASEAIAHFQHTLTTGEPYHQSALIETRRDSGVQESYDWQIERITLPSGEPGVVCYYYDLTTQRRAQAALLSSERRFRGTFENAAVGVAHVELDGRFREVNERLCEILGYSRDDLLARSFQECTHPDDLAADLANMAKLRAGECSFYTMDKRYLRGDGGVVWTGLTVSLQQDESGRPDYFIKVVRDISQRKEAQAHQQFLLRELAHRMKNQLAVIQAMAGQTARYAASLTEFRDVFFQRIQGLAVATDVLVSQGWRGARLDELVDRQLKAFVPGPTRLACAGPDVLMTPDATEAIGLALHELATNCAKHGAWSVASGTVAVSWQAETVDAHAPSLRLTWQERGGPPVAVPLRKGFGHVVIESMVARKVGGDAELTFAPDGLRWSLVVPPAHFADAAPHGDASPWTPNVRPVD